MQLSSILAVVDSGIMLLINMLLNQKKLPKFCLSFSISFNKSSLKGIDYLGIVPEDVTPKYCQSFFPKEDQIIEFINPWHDDEIVKVIKEFSDWYPVDILEPRL